MAAIGAVESRTAATSGCPLSFALPICAIGIVSLLRDSWPTALYLPGIDLHVVFGVMLWLMVVAQFRRASHCGVALSGVRLEELCRELSRGVYLLLYVLFGASQVLRIAAIFWNRGTQGAMHPAILQSPENLRDYLAYGVFALLAIRVLAAAQRSPSTSSTNESGISAGRG